MIPDPGLGVDRLADRAQEPQRRQVALRRPLRPPAHERADGGRRRVEHGDAMALDDLPEPILLRPVGRALVHHHRGAVGQRAVDHVAVPGHPPDVGGAPVDVVRLEVEHPLGGGIAAGEVAAGGVHDPLRLPGRARRVEDVEHVLGVHRLWRADVRRVLHQLVVPVVPPGLHVDAQIGGAAADDDDAGDRRGRRQRLVGHLLERHDIAATVAAVGGDQHLALRVVDAIAQRIGAEPAEHHVVHRADAGAGQHGDGQLGNQRHVDRHAVAATDAQTLQHVGELRDLAVEIEVGQGAAIARLTFPDQRGLVAAAAPERAGPRS